MLFDARLIEHGLTSAPTQYRSYGRRFRCTKASDDARL